MNGVLWWLDVWVVLVSSVVRVSDVVCRCGDERIGVMVFFF